ncbi:pPIWI_RE_Y domain-containing protein [Dactylosporangium darangshiense]|uniref:REase associating with pPIWI RE domain-containing protein n=1 Tax=Dactylosporangium darangshiense TaxID=579108 RepID=A0ABP8CTV5_9ACTN
MDTDQHPWPEDWEITFVHQLAAGLIEYADLCRVGEPIRLPYPSNLQRALDRLTLMCQVQGVTPPGSVMDLLRWARRPLADWPIGLDVPRLDVDEALLAFGYPSVACEELGRLRGDVEGELRENALIGDVMDVCRANDREDAYVAFRELLIRRPAMSELDLAEQLHRPELALLSAQLRAAYREAPPEALLGGVAQVCGGCGNLRTPAEDMPQRMCVDPACPDPGKPWTELPAVEGVLWIGRELRTFIAAPGRAELRIADSLRAAGVPIELWPRFDACDLAVFSTDVWAVDVKAWASPTRLAARLAARPFHPPSDASRAFIVIADEQCRARPGYLRQLVRALPSLGPGGRVTAMSEREFSGEVKRRLKEES